MNIGTKYGMMQKIVCQLAELKGSQHMAIKKIGEMEVQSIQLEDGQLEMKLAAIYENVAMNLEKLEMACSFYQQKLDEFAVANNFHMETI